MIEYSRELLNSNCDFGFITSVFRCSNEIRSRILRSTEHSADNQLDEFVGTKKMVFDMIDKYNQWRGDIIPNKKFDVELSWKFAMDMIVKDLKKMFVDSIVYSENKEIYDKHNNVTIHRLIIVDWN
tara:strand:+ start:61 stop:438 length:378 start_codon:yes stop_codon:yes gene_type:complete